MSSDCIGATLTEGAGSLWPYKLVTFVLEKLVKDGPPPGKEHRKPENYYKDVLKGACLVADECSRDVIFE